MFAFAKYEHGDILAEGRKELTAIAEQLKAADNASITVAGHTDRIGSDADNQLLSQRRARTVRQYLIDSGVDAASIRAEGWGESEPVKACEDGQDREALIACLQPNRRVEIQVNATSAK